MCTVIKLEDKNSPSIAKEDIKVYKFGEYMSPSEFKSDFQRYKYTSEKLCKAKMIFDEYRNLVSDEIEVKYLDSLPKNQRLFITKGFHSFTTLKRLRKSDAFGDDNNIGLFIIPKDSLYYKNKCNNIVSNQIIFKHFI